MEYTWKEIIFAALGSSGLIGGVVTAFVFVAGRLDARRKRMDDARSEAIHDSVELKKISMDAALQGNEAIVTSLWRIIEEKNKELAALKADLDDCEKGDRLSNRNVNKIFASLRSVKNEMDSINIMVLGEEETNVFARRWHNIKHILDDLEKTLEGD